jgi:hypothetical protein
MTDPAKYSFSAVCIRYGTCGALGLLDQDWSEESDMDRTCATEGIWGDFRGGRKGGQGKQGNTRSLDEKQLRGLGVIGWILNTRVELNVDDA